MTAPTFTIAVLGRQVAAAAQEASVQIEGLQVSAIAPAGSWTGAVIHSLAVSDAVLIDAGIEASQRRRALVLARHLGVPRLVFAAPTQQVAGDAGSEFAGEARRAGLQMCEVVVFDHTSDVAAWVRRAMADKAGRRAEAAPFRLAATSSSEARAATTRLDGALLSGWSSVGQEMLVLPEAVSARIIAIEPLGADPAYVGVQLDQPVPWSAGSLLVPSAQRPEIADQVAAQIIWIGPRPLLPGRPYTIDLAGQSASAQISALKHRIDPADFAPAPARKLEAGDIGLANVSFSSPLIFDAFDVNRATGRFAILDRQSGALAGFGLIVFPLRRATNIHRQALAVNKAARAALKGQRPCCLWFTGLSGSGKSTVASLVEKQLNGRGRHTYVLDGDNIRHGLNRDLGFTDADRVENIRRVAEVAKLFVDAGLIVMVSFISPFRAERRLARDLFPPGEFLEIFVDTPLEICEQRDPKGLYRKARTGQLKNFTGIDSPYEPPDAAEMHLDGGTMGADALVAQVMSDLAHRGVV